MSAGSEHNPLVRRVSELERQLAELSFETDARRRFEFITNAADQFVTIINRHYIYENVNQAYCRARQQDASDIVGHSVADLWGQEKFESIIKKVLDRCFCGEVVAAEEWFSFDGQEMRYHQITYYPYADEDGHVTHAVVVTNDITARKKAEDALQKAHDELERRVLQRTAQLEKANLQLKKEIFDRKQTEEELRKYEHIVASSNDQLSLIDRNYVHQAANACYLKTYGKKRHEVIGKSVKEVMGEKLFQRAIKPKLDDCLAGKEITFRDWFDLSPQGRRCMDVACYPFRDTAGNITGAVINARDITEKKILEDQLLQAKKMEAIGTLAGGIAHDFNNLLMGIQGHISLLEIEIGQNNRSAESLQSIERLVESGAQLTRQLLGFARGGKYIVKPINLNDLVEKTAAIFGRTRKTIRIQAKYQDDVWTVEADQGQIEQVLINLFLNAWQAMEENGDLVLETCNTVLDQQKTGGHEANPGAYVCISVTDSGKGIDKTIQHRIFEPFFTTREFGRGSGLGLASVFGIIKNHGGFIDFQSTPGQGSTFRVYLPASLKKPKRRPEIRETMQHGLETILLVDDEAYILKVCTEMLNLLGYQVMAADNGKDALLIFEQNRDKIDLVILDMIMPKMSGQEVARKLRSSKSDIKILLASGYKLEQEMAKTDCEFNGSIQKPFKLNQLSSAIRKVLDAPQTK
jgi:PAS domain S-box-containing protein